MTENEFVKKEKQMALERRERDFYKLKLKPTMTITVWKNGSPNVLMPGKELDEKFDIVTPQVWKDLVEALLPTLDVSDEIVIEVGCSAKSKIRDTYRGLEIERQ